MKVTVRVLCISALVMLVWRCIDSKKMPITGREFRKSYPELLSSGKMHHHRSLFRRFQHNPLVRRLNGRHVQARRWVSSLSPSLRMQARSSLFVRRRAPRRSANVGTGVKSRIRFTKKSRGLPLQKKYWLNRCKAIKKGKCCKGWKKHSLTGYCMPACRDFCHHGTCINDHMCECNPGFQGPLCDIDVNECSQQVCHHGCLNTYGSYRCLCNKGYTLQNDETCHEIDPCIPKKCQYRCYLDGIKPKCVCPKGFRLQKDQRHCQDVNECSERDVRCDLSKNSQSCKNLPGSYVCVCNEGYFYSRHLKRCHDSNECLLETHSCNITSSRCLNTEGSFRCECRGNFTKIGEACLPTEEPQNEEFARNATDLFTPIES